LQENICSKTVENIGKLWLCLHHS